MNLKNLITERCLLDLSGYEWISEYMVCVWNFTQQYTWCNHTTMLVMFCVWFCLQNGCDQFVCAEVDQ